MPNLSINVSEKIATEDKMVGGDGITRYLGPEGTLYSVYPPTAFLTFGNWIYLVPPFKPKSVLMLGYAGGTVAGLIRLLYGPNVQLRAADPNIPTESSDKYGTSIIQADARWISTPAECVILDIFEGQKTPSFVASYEFAESVNRLAMRFLIIHADPDTDMGVYEQFFTRLRVMDIGHKIYYYKKPDDPTNYFPH